MLDAVAFFERLSRKEGAVSVTGLGYVGLPVALELARVFRVVGFDVKPERVEQLRRNEDPSAELDAAAFAGTDIHFTADAADLKAACFHIIAVPTPIDKHAQPELRPLLAASASVGRALKKGDVVVYESTVYPGCTEEDCVPILEQESGLAFGHDFTVGYSPERINPGDKEHTLTKIAKVVSGSDAETLTLVAQVYGAIITIPNGIFQAQSIKVAEAAKIIENTQRDLNIALMNELAMIFDKLDINTYDVLAAAGTKWNFLRFVPGLVGGHCIGVDPYYLTYKARAVGIDPAVIAAGRRINDGMPAYAAKKIIQRLISMDKDLNQARVLVMGATFKENVKDIRNSKVADLCQELIDYSLQVDLIDPHASPEEMQEEYGLTLSARPTGRYDAVILATPHAEYLKMPAADVDALLVSPGLLADLKGVWKKMGEGREYWSL